MKAETFFTEEEKERIAATIAAAEQKTAGEIAVMIVDKSDSYPESALLAGLFLGSLLALPLSDFFFDASLWAFFPLLITLASLGWIVAHQFDGLKKIFLLPKRMDDMVQRCALRSFHEKELYRTRDQTGVLFFVSLLEHRVWILADKGIYQKIQQEALQEFASGIAAGIRDGTGAAALCRQIDEISTILAEHFPIKPDDVNELPDTLITS